MALPLFGVDKDALPISRIVYRILANKELLSTCKDRHTGFVNWSELVILTGYGLSNLSSYRTLTSVTCIACM